MAKTIVAGDDPGTYEVVVVGKTRQDGVIAEVYSSSTKSWKVRGSLPHGLVIRNDEMFVCNGFLFCLTVPDGMMAYHFREGKSVGIDVPDSRSNIWHRLVACESSIVMVGGIEENHVLKEVRMWELLHKDAGYHDGDGFSWKEMGKMPESVCRQFRRDSCSTWFECVGVGDKICFRAHGSLQVVVYSVTHGSWSWLHISWPDPHGQDRKNLHLRSLAFQPSLHNYKV